MKGYIYKIINVENGHFYVGSTIEIEKRKKIVRIKHDITCFIESLFCLNTNLINKINNSLIFKDITKKL